MTKTPPSHYFKIVALATIASLLIFAGYFLPKALADEDSADISATQIKVSLNITGDKNGTASLDKTIYYSGDSAVLTWKGACIGTDFVIPKSISYNKTTINLATLNKMDSMQTANTEYARRMGSSSTMTTYDSIKDFITKNNTVALPNLTIDTTVTIDFVRVSPVYRMYNMISSEHLFSTNKKEYDNWVKIGEQDKDAWVGEGIDWLAPTADTSNTVIHRLYNAGLGAMGHSSHYYTADAVEMTNLISNYGWKDDGEENYIRSGGSQSIYTCYNEGLGSAHHYSSSKTEWEGLEAHQWQLERDKNGDTGVFQGVAAVRWYTPSSYYTVYHQLENLDGTYSTYETQTIQGAPKSKTNAKAKSYAGYTAQSFSQTTVDAANITRITIKYKRNAYKVNFSGNGQKISTAAQSVKYGAKITKPRNPSVNGQTFIGWYWDAEGNNEFKFGTQTMSASNITVYAKWQEIPTVTYRVRHIYQKTDENYTETLAEGMEVETLKGEPGKMTQAKAKNKTGFTPQSGWSNVAIAGNGSTVIDIKYDRNPHILKFNYQGKGNTPDSEPIQLLYGQEIDVPADPTDTQYNFAGWYTEPECENHWGHDGVTKRTMPDSDLTLYAFWTQKPVLKVTFETNGGTEIRTEEVVSGSTIKRPDEGATTKTGYDFVEWYSDPEMTKDFDFTQPITSDTTIYAKWKGQSGITYKVVHKKQNVDGSYTDAEQEEETLSGTAGDIAGVMVKTNYIGFKTPSAPQVAIKGDGTTVVEVLYERQTFTVTFSTERGEPKPIAKEDVRYGATISAPNPEPAELGWQFEGWFKEASFTTQWNFSEDVITTHTTLHAKWKRAEYPIVYVLGGEDVVHPGTPDKYEYGIGVDSQKLVSPTKPGAKFDGWYTGPNGTGSKVTRIEPYTTGTVTLYANWIESAYTIVYNTQMSVEGDFSEVTATSSETITLKGKDKDGNDIVSKGRILSGWSLKSEATESDTVWTPGAFVPVSDLVSGASASGVITLYAQWSQTVQVTFLTNGHGSQESIVKNITKGTAVAKPDSEALAKDVPGLEIQGWYEDAKCSKDKEWNFDTTIDAAKVLYANWVPSKYGDQMAYWLGYSNYWSKANTDALANKLNENYVAEEWNVKMSSAEIQADMQVLHDGETEENPTYATVKAKWEEFMNSDEYHLYTKIINTDGNEENNYVEFRVIQVGAHQAIGDNVADKKTGEIAKTPDESVITFRAVHALPTEYLINETATNKGGWKDSLLRKNMLEPAAQGIGLGGIWNLFEQGFTGDIKEVTKWTREGSNSLLQASDTMLSTKDKLWIASLTEIFGKEDAYIDANDNVLNEGDWYPWYEKMKHDGNWYETIYPIQYEYKTRARTEPADTQQDGIAALRSPRYNTTQYFHGYTTHWKTVSYIQASKVHWGVKSCNANKTSRIVVSFCF